MPKILATRVLSTRSLIVRRSFSSTALCLEKNKNSQRHIPQKLNILEVLKPSLSLSSFPISHPTSSEIPSSTCEACQPMSGTYSPKDSALVVSLVALAAKNPQLVKSTAYGTMIDGAEVKIRSWKMNEFKYDIPSPFPTLERGLFTRDW